MGIGNWQRATSRITRSQTCFEKSSLTRGSREFLSGMSRDPLARSAILFALLIATASIYPADARKNRNRQGNGVAKQESQEQCPYEGEPHSVLDGRTARCPVPHGQLGMHPRRMVTLPHLAHPTWPINATRVSPETTSGYPHKPRKCKVTEAWISSSSSCCRALQCSR